MISGIVTSFTLGFLYFISAIPAGVAAHAPLWIAVVAAWCGYSLGATLILLAGVPLRQWLLRRLNIDPHPDPTKLFWRIWQRFGLWGLGLIAPITIGPQATAALALALGESPRRIQQAVSFGALPWAIGLGLLTQLGLHALKSS